MKFQVGEIAIFFNPDSPRHKMECEVIEGLQEGRIVDDATMNWRPGMFYRIQFPSDDVRYAAEEHQLKKIPPPDTKTSWDQCLFQPNPSVVH